ncbi:class F sortase [uncultured Streptomyces sp.]|uniref:class F sortase n=1 Tax=uncultured Streptomyces sp. TaxID=174707 RepID=UPI00343F8AAC
METGRSPQPPSPPSSQPFPTAKHLLWTVVAGTVLVVGGLRDADPPQPPPAPAAAPAPVTADRAPAPALAAHVPARAPHYLFADRPDPGPPALVRRLTAPLALLPRRPFRPTPLRPPPASPPPTARPSEPAPPAAARDTAAARSGVPPLAPSEPLRLRIPGLQVDSPLVKLSLDAKGALETPPDNNPVLSGWYADGTVPGSVGTAVTTGHVDTRLGPGVFYGLGALRRGATVEIVRADRSVAVFTVYAVEAYDKKTFPDEKVYGPSDRPELRVITCGGTYSEKSGYPDNVVVFAALTGSR